jgi:hypothetical protein
MSSPGYSGSVLLVGPPSSGDPAYSGPVAVLESLWLGEAGFSGPAPTIAYSIIGTIEQTALLSGSVTAAAPKITGTIAQTALLSGSVRGPANRRISGTINQVATLSGTVRRSGLVINGTIHQIAVLTGELKWTAPTRVIKPVIVFDIYRPSPGPYLIDRPPDIDVHHPSILDYFWVGVPLAESEQPPPILDDRAVLLTLTYLPPGRYLYRFLAQREGTALTQDYLLFVRPASIEANV